MSRKRRLRTPAPRGAAPQRHGPLAYAALAVITALAAYLRFQNLAALPLWVDEAWFAAMVQGEHPVRQEFPYVGLSRIVGVFAGHSEFWLRFPAALLGTLTVPALFWALRRRAYALPLCLFVATFPLFVYWSRLARPYAFAGFFVVLGWRFWPSHLIALLTTPVALVGVVDFGRLRTRRGLWVTGVLVAGAILLFFVRPDSGRDFWNWGFITHARRLWYIPLLAVALHCGKYLLPALRSGNPRRPTRLV